MAKLLRSKRGNLTDMPFLTVALVVLALTILLSGGTLYVIIDNFENSTVLNENNITTNNLVPIRDKFFPLMDFTFIIAFFGFWIVIYISAFFIKTNPIFLGVATFFVFITIIISAVFSNYFGEVAQQLFCNTCSFSLITNIQSQLPLTLFIMEKLPFFVFPMSCLLLIILYSKRGEV